MTTNLLKSLLSFLSLFFQFFSVYAISFCARGRRPRRRGGKKPGKSAHKKTHRPATGGRSRGSRALGRTKAQRAPRISGADATFIMRSEEFEGVLKKLQSALVAMSISGRLKHQIPDGNGRRTMVNNLVASFPLSGNSAAGFPDLRADDGLGGCSVLLSISPTLRSTITAFDLSSSDAKNFQSSLRLGQFSPESKSNFFSSVRDQMYDFSDGVETAKVLPLYTQNTVPKNADFLGDYVYAPLLQNADPNDTSDAILAPTAPLNGVVTFAGYIATGTSVLVNTVDLTAAGSFKCGWYNGSTYAKVAEATASAGVAASTVTVGTTSGVTAGDILLPYVTIVKNASVVNQISVSYSKVGTDSYAACANIDMPGASDSLWLNTFKMSRVTAFVAWFQNTSNIAKVGGDCAAFWLNPDQAAGYIPDGASSALAYASSITRDTKVGPFTKGLYCFERIRREMLKFQNSLNMDSGYRLIMALIPGGAKTDVTGFIHIYMTVESEVESKVLTGTIAPESPNGIAMWETAMSQIPNACMENAMHTQIMKAIMSGVSKIWNLPFIRGAVGAGVNGALSSLAESAYNAIPATHPTDTYFQDYQSERRPRGYRTQKGGPVFY